MSEQSTGIAANGKKRKGDVGFGEPWSTRRRKFTAESLREIADTLHQQSRQLAKQADRVENLDGAFAVVDGATKGENGVANLAKFIANVNHAIELSEGASLFDRT